LRVSNADIISSAYSRPYTIHLKAQKKNIVLVHKNIQIIRKKGMIGLRKNDINFCRNRAIRLPK